MINDTELKAIITSNNTNEANLREVVERYIYDRKQVSIKIACTVDENTTFNDPFLQRFSYLNKAYEAAQRYYFNLFKL